MKKKTLLTVAILATNLISSQNITSKKWNDMFSYNNVLAIKEDHGKIVAATENGIFYYHISSGEISKLSKANGLHEVKISAFDYNPSTKVGLVGYLNGSMDIITPNGITYVVDIPIATGFNGDKRINHISISGEKAIISTNYGISIFDLNKKEFAQSAFFVTGGSLFEASKEAIIKDNVIYACTQSGVKMHDLDVTFPVYSTWQTLSTGDFKQADVDSSIVLATANTVYYGTGTSFNPIPHTFNDITDVVVTSDNIIVTDKERIYVYTSNGLLQNNFTVGELCNTATVINGTVYGGTQDSGIKDINKKTIKPDGPFNNRAYRIQIEGEKLWVSTGARTDRYNAASPDPKNLGFYYYNGMQWIYPSHFTDNTTTIYNVLDIVPNPSDLNEVFFVNYSQKPGQGIYKMRYNDGTKNFSLEKYYQTNHNIDNNFNRPTGLAFDKNNNLFGTMTALLLENSTFSSGLMVYDRNADEFKTSGLMLHNTTQKPVIYEDKLWIPMPRTNAFLVRDYRNTPLNFSDDITYRLLPQNGLPSSSEGSISVAFDKNDDAWIGTDSGLRILPNASTAITENPPLESVIIEQNNIAEELFRDNLIHQVEVDTGNYKWVSVDRGGVYYLSSDGEKIIKHFTKENSPLPTNSVTDIKIDHKTGKVYFVTFEGIVSYQGDVVDVTSNFGDVVVYPNPVVYSNFKGLVTIRGLAEKTNIRIVDAAGNLVHQAVSRGGFHEWNLNNQRGKRVASGIYFVLMTNEDGSDKATAKIAVVN